MVLPSLQSPDAFSSGENLHKTTADATADDAIAVVVAAAADADGFDDVLLL